jgi:antitoxin HigA-1
MVPNISYIKGLPPGIILDRELKKRRLKKKHFAYAINEFPQTLGAVILGKRRINPLLSIKFGRYLGIDESYFMLLQTYYDLVQEKKKQTKGSHPDLSIIRPVVFWDTDPDKIDWEKYKVSVIHRIFERGNEQEILEIIRFYSEDTIKSVMKESSVSMPSAVANIEKYLS